MSENSVKTTARYVDLRELEYDGDDVLVVGGGGREHAIVAKLRESKRVGKIYGAPCIVIDCGTATTFNVISADGELLGGAISFGLKAAAESLSSSAARLPKVELSAPKRAIGKTTITNMQSGIIYGYSGMIESMVARLKAEAGLPDAKVIATGGISDIVNRCVSVIDVVDRTLTLRGLNILYKLNKR